MCHAICSNELAVMLPEWIEISNTYHIARSSTHDMLPGEIICFYDVCALGVIQPTSSTRGVSNGGI